MSQGAEYVCPMSMILFSPTLHRFIHVLHVLGRGEINLSFSR